MGCVKCGGFTFTEDCYGEGQSVRVVRCVGCGRREYGKDEVRKEWVQSNEIAYPSAGNKGRHWWNH